MVASCNRLLWVVLAALLFPAWSSGYASDAFDRFADAQYPVRVQTITLPSGDAADVYSPSFLILTGPQANSRAPFH